MLARNRYRILDQRDLENKLFPNDWSSTHCLLGFRRWLWLTISCCGTPMWWPTCSPFWRAVRSRFSWPASTANSRPFATAGASSWRRNLWKRAHKTTVPRPSRPDCGSSNSGRGGGKTAATIDDHQPEAATIAMAMTVEIVAAGAALRFATCTLSAIWGPAALSWLTRSARKSSHLMSPLCCRKQVSQSDIYIIVTWNGFGCKYIDRSVTDSFLIFRQNRFSLTNQVNWSMIKRGKTGALAIKQVQLPHSPVPKSYPSQSVGSRFKCFK